MTRRKIERIAITNGNVEWAAREVEAFMERPTVGPWVRLNRPNMWGRFGPDEMDGPSYALGALKRALLLPEVGHDIFRRDHQMIALSQRFDQVRVRRLANGCERQGRLIDYVADSDVTAYEHVRIANQLKTAEGYRGPVVATLTPIEEERARGIREVLHSIGELSLIEVVESPRDIGLSGERVMPYHLFASEPV